MKLLRLVLFLGACHSIKAANHAPTIKQGISRSSRHAIYSGVRHS